MNQSLLATRECEAQQIHDALFTKRKLPPEVVARYERALTVCTTEYDATDAPLIHALLEKGWDIEACEYAWRMRDKANALSKRVQILCYLLEVRRAYFEDFVQTTSTPLRAWLGLGVALPRAAWKLVKGRFLLWRLRHGLPRRPHISLPRRPGHG